MKILGGRTVCILLGFAAVAAINPVGARAAEPVRLILDTDIGNDIDDTLALAAIHALSNRGEVQLLAVTITKDNPYAAVFVDVMNTYYGRPEIPIGVVRDGKTKDSTAMLETPVEQRHSNGQPVFPRRLKSGKDAPEAVSVLRRVLAEQPDHSVTIVQIGFSTNLARLVKSSEGRELVEKKVKLLCLMAGNFSAKPEREYNIYTDAKAAKELLEEWPTEMIFSGFEIGITVMFPYADIEKDFQYAANHPVVSAFKAFAKPGEDRANYDSTAVLEAIRGDRGYFELSERGRVTLGGHDITKFTPDPQGKCRYMILKPENRARVQEALVTLASEPPQGGMVKSGAGRVTF
jgi:inosine-uridine nucleoside N-ribohydrolase